MAEPDNADYALLDAWRCVRRHRLGEGPAPTARQVAIVDDPTFAARLELAQRRAGTFAGANRQQRGSR